MILHEENLEFTSACDGNPVWNKAPKPSANPLKKMEWANNKLKDKFGCTRTNPDGSKKFHAGIDIKAAVGTPCYAIENGKVESVARGNDLGRWVTLSFNKNGKIFGVAYCHLSKVTVKEGSIVKAGDKIAETGIDGNVGNDEPHLHLEIQNQIWVSATDRWKYSLDPNEYVSEGEKSKAKRIKTSLRNKWKTPNSGDDSELSLHQNSENSCIRNQNQKPWKLGDSRIAESLKKIRSQINQLAPQRNKVSDGWFGDISHQNRDSDHNPWLWDEQSKKGIVTALDITHDVNGKCDCNKLADSLKLSMDSRIKYIIWNKQIMYSEKIENHEAWTWRQYTGSNPHDKHIHISVRCKKDIYDDKSDWKVLL